MGAQLSNTVHNLFVEKKVIAGKKVNALPKKKPIISEKTEAEVKKEAAPTEEAPAESAPVQTEAAAE
jgi:hypothetical protein